jgi:hypothetical protein
MLSIADKFCSRYILSRCALSPIRPVTETFCPDTFCPDALYLRYVLSPRPFVPIHFVPIRSISDTSRHRDLLSRYIFVPMRSTSDTFCHRDLLSRYILSRCALSPIRSVTETFCPDTFCSCPFFYFSIPRAFDLSSKLFLIWFKFAEVQTEKSFGGV